MEQDIDDFTIVLPQPIDMSSCDLKLYSGLDRLWRMVERYQMTSPISIRVFDNKAGHVRAIRSSKDATTGWTLKDETSTATPVCAGQVEFPLTIRVQDAKGNILKMKLQVADGDAEKASSFQEQSTAELTVGPQK